MPIAISSEELARLRSWVDGSRQNSDNVLQADYVKRLNEQSRRMTREWPNSLENVNKRNEELRRARIEAVEQTNSKFYKKYMRQKRNEQARLMYSARDTIFKNKDAPKMLLRAVIETCVQKERGAQLQFNAERKREAAEAKRKSDDEIIRHAKEWHQLMATRRARRFQVDKQIQKEIVEQAEQRIQREREEHETEIKYQKIDNIKAQEQMDAIAEFQHNFAMEEKARIFADMKKSKAEIDERRMEERMLDQLDDSIIQVLQRSKARTEAQRRATEQQARDEKQRLLDINSKKLQSGVATQELQDKLRLEAAVRKLEQTMDERTRKEEATRARHRRERQELHEQQVAAEKKQQHELHTMRTWEMMNRFKNEEIYQDYLEKQRQDKARKIKEFREDAIRLWKERDEREARERAETRYFYGELAERKLRDADNKLFAHAQELVEEARRHGRPDHALRKAVDYYCSLYRLHPAPPLPASLQAHFPGYAARDGCAPDAGYVPARPPAPDTRAPPGKRSGLQPLDNAAPGPSEPEAREETVADYKRVGRANGLQRAAQPVEVVKLPAIKAVLCPKPDCACPGNK